MRTAARSSRGPSAGQRNPLSRRARSSADDERRRPPGTGFDFSRLPIEAPPARRTMTVRMQTAPPAGTADRGCCGTGSCTTGSSTEEPKHEDTGVVQLDENEMGDTGANGSGPASSPAPAQTPAQSPAATADCECCVDDVTISNISRIDNAVHMGHSFDCTIAMQYPPAMASGGGLSPCRLEWWEKTNVPYAPGQTAGKWHDMFALIPNSPTLAPWVNRGGTCGTSQAVVITDPPALGKRAGRTVTRTLEFDIKVFSAPGSSCTNASKNVTATQVLNMVGGAPDWPGSSFTTP